MTLLTFGHSNLEMEQGIELLFLHDVDLLVDVRSHPTSKWPQWRGPMTKRWLEANRIRYVWWPGLGGWSEDFIAPADIDHFAQFDVDLEPYTHGAFPRQRIARKSNHVGWTNMGFYDYQFFMSLPRFMKACAKLIRLGQTRNIAYMCSEAVWWHCHRSMIADYLMYLGTDSYHIQTKDHHSDVIGNRLQRYHPYVTQQWEEYAAQS